MTQISGKLLYSQGWQYGTFRQWCRSLLSIGGIICNFTPILPYFQHWGINLDHDFVQVWKFSEDQKNAKGTLFSPNSGEDQKKKRSSSKIQHFFPQFSLRCTPIQIIGGDTAKSLGGYIPPSPPCFRTLAFRICVLYYVSRTFNRTVLQFNF